MKIIFLNLLQKNRNRKIVNKHIFVLEDFKFLCKSVLMCENAFFSLSLNRHGFKFHNP